MNDLVTTTANCRRELKRLLKEYNAGKMRELPFRTAVRKVE